MQKQKKITGGLCGSGVHLGSPTSPGAYKAGTVGIRHGLSRIRRTTVTNNNLKGNVLLFRKVGQKKREDFCFIESRG